MRNPEVTKVCGQLASIIAIIPVEPVADAHTPKITFVTTPVLTDHTFRARALLTRARHGKSEIQISRWRSQIVRMNSQIDKQRIEELAGKQRKKERERERGGGEVEYVERETGRCISDSYAQGRFNDILLPLKLKSCKGKAQNLNKHEWEKDK